MKKPFYKILLGLGCIAILGSINNISPSLSTPDTTTVVEKASLTQIQHSILCVTPHYDGWPFEH